MQALSEDGLGAGGMLGVVNSTCTQMQRVLRLSMHVCKPKELA